MRLGSSVAVLVLAVSAIPSHAEALMDASEVLAKSKEAAGGAAWDDIRSTHSQMKIMTGGLEGTAEGWDDLITGRSLSTYKLGLMSGGDGFDGEIAWTKDSSGQIRLREGDDEYEGAINEAYRIAHAYWYPERWGAEMEYGRLQEEDGNRFHVITIRPEGGRPFELWIDADSYLVSRTVERSAIETRTLFLSDYRRSGGVLYPFASRSTNGETRYDVVSEVESLEFNEPLNEDLFATPAAPPPDYTFSDDRTSVTIPFKLLNNHIYVNVTLNGRGPYLVICDTGGANIVTPALAGELGLKPEGRLQGRGAGEKSEDISMVKIESLGVGDVTLRNQVFLVFPLEPFSNVEGVHQSGLIGYEVFKRFVVNVDYEDKLLTMTLPGAFSYEGNGTVVPFQCNGRIPQVEGSIDGISGMFDIDTGARSSLHLMRPFVEKNDLVALYKPDVEAVTGWGVGGAVRGMVTRSKGLKLGGVEFADPVTELSLQMGGAFTNTYVAGNVGTKLLKRYNITFDYDRKQMIFEKNSNTGDPDVYDRSGMWLSVDGSVFRVIDITSGGPASDAGLEIGDDILSVDGVSAGEMSLPSLREQFVTDPPGTEIMLRVRSGKEESQVTLTLEDLV